MEQLLITIRSPVASLLYREGMVLPGDLKPNHLAGGAILIDRQTWAGTPCRYQRSA
jgi:predicted cation transporter